MTKHEYLQLACTIVVGILPETPAQGETVTSPVTISGQSSTFEGNVRWSVTQEGGLDDQGFTTGGSIDGYAPYPVTVELEPGEYTLKLWEPNQAAGQEAWTDEIAVVYTDFIVE